MHVFLGYHTCEHNRGLNSTPRGPLTCSECTIACSDTRRDPTTISWNPEKFELLPYPRIHYQNVPLAHLPSRAPEPF
jgi:hypothetical protein